jgi:hypothetical protein
MGRIPLSGRFSCLFYLAENKLSTVAEMSSLGWEIKEATWVWQRQLWVHEMLGSVRLYFTISFCRPINQICGSGSVILFEVTQFVMLISSWIFTTCDFNLDAAEKLVWHNQVPLNESIFAWRLLRDRLPTKTNLLTRGIITPKALFCLILNFFVRNL